MSSPSLRPRPPNHRVDTVWRQVAALPRRPRRNSRTSGTIACWRPSARETSPKSNWPDTRWPAERWERSAGFWTPNAAQSCWLQESGRGTGTRKPQTNIYLGRQKQEVNPSQIVKPINFTICRLEQPINCLFQSSCMHDLTIWTSSHCKHVKYGIIELAPLSPVHRMIFFFQRFGLRLLSFGHVTQKTSGDSFISSVGVGRLSSVWIHSRPPLYELLMLQTSEDWSVCVCVCKSVWRICAYFKIHFSVREPSNQLLSFILVGVRPEICLFQPADFMFPPVFWVPVWSQKIFL